MKKLVVMSGKYAFCIEGFQRLLQKYWSGAVFTVISHIDPPFPLDTTLSFERLGGGFTDSTPWRELLESYIAEVDCDYFFLCFEDHFLIDFVNSSAIERAGEIMETDKQIGKIRLHPAYIPEMPGYNETESYDEIFYQEKSVNKTAATSLRPAVWRKSLFLKYLRHPAHICTPHDFEVFNDSVPLTERILLPKSTSPLFPELDAMRRGTFNPETLKPGPQCVYPSRLELSRMTPRWTLYPPLQLCQEDVEIFKENQTRYYELQR